jgi:hypothetical protein
MTEAIEWVAELVKLLDHRNSSHSLALLNLYNPPQPWRFPPAPN